MTESTAPTSAGAHVIHGDRAAPAETIGEPGDNYREVNLTATPFPAAEPNRFSIRLTPVHGRVNLIPNSSFELGGGDGWCTANNSRNQAVHIFSEADHVRDAFHGEYAIRLPGKGVGGMQCSRVFELPAGGTFTFSGYVKAVADGGAKLNLRITPIGNSPGADLHWKDDPRVWRDVRLPDAAGEVTVADMYGNLRDDVVANGGDLVFDLNEEPTFIFNGGLSDEALLAMVRGITAAPRPMDMCLAFIPDGKGGVALGVRAANNTPTTLKGLDLDANFPPNRMLSRVDWTLPSRSGSIGDILAGQSVWGRLATKIGLDLPVENATYTVWITDADGREHRMCDTCWMSVAPRLTASLDGRLDEWRDVHPAWMYYTYAWDRFGRHNVQFQRQGEHFNYVYRIDARAAIYAAHDDRNLYLAVRCEDDDLVRSGAAPAADRLKFRLNVELGQREGAQTLALDPTEDGVRLSGSLAGGAEAQIRVTDARNEYAPHKVWIVELAVPLSSLGGSKNPGDAIGFDVVWRDADHDGKQVVTGEWRWAGRSTSLGTLFFTR